MELMDKIQTLAARIPGQMEHIQSEEATKNALIMPFITALGYDVFDLTEVFPEYTADFGALKGARVDYAIMKEGRPIMLFECQPADVNLDDMQTAQLAGFFEATEARFGVLTNGVVYRFHSDLYKSRGMDLKPFFEIDLLKLDGELLKELERFTKSSFNVGENVEAAVELKYTKEIMWLLSEEMREPSDDFVRFFAKQIYSEDMNQAARRRSADRTKEAFNQLINTGVYARLNSTIANEGEPTADTEVMTSSPKEEIVGERPRSVVTDTSEELEGFYVVKSILRNVVEPNRVAMRNLRTYCGIFLDNKNNKPICRLWFDGSKKWLGLYDEKKKEEKVALSELDDIYQFADRLRDTVARYDSRAANIEKKIDPSLVSVS
jgi:hypothetical protein